MGPDGQGRLAGVLYRIHKKARVVTPMLEYKLPPQWAVHGTGSSLGFEPQRSESMMDLDYPMPLGGTQNISTNRLSTQRTINIRDEQHEDNKTYTNFNKIDLDCFGKPTVGFHPYASYRS